MSFSTSDTWLVLEGTPLPDGIDDLAPRLLRAGGILEAAVHLARSRPSAVVGSSKVHWHETFIRTLPRGRLPIIVVGDRDLGPDLATVSLPEGASPEECRARLGVLFSARQRPGRSTPPDTGRARSAA